MHIHATRVYSFTNQLGNGNPAGVVFNSERLNETQMKAVSRQLQVSETAFVSPIKITDFAVRFFSPTVEVDLCGHATIGAFSVIGKQHEKKKKKQLKFTQKTHAGNLPVLCYYTDNHQLDCVMMKQQKLQIKSVNYTYNIIANSLNIQRENLLTYLPKNRISTGLFTLPIGINSWDVLKNITPNFKTINSLCQKYNVGSFHLFTFDIQDKQVIYHARNFAPAYGINEDPVTGTANGALCAYLKQIGEILDDTVICEQGTSKTNTGRVYVDLSKDSVWIGGNAAIDTTQELIV